MRKLLMLSLVSLSLFACGDKTDDTAGGEETVSGEADLANGQTIHDSMCMACHASNPDMESNTPNLSDGTGKRNPKRFWFNARTRFKRYRFARCHCIFARYLRWIGFV